MWTTLRVKTGRPNHRENHIFWVLPPWTQLGSYSEYWRKIPSCFQQEGKRNNHEICQNSLLNTSYPHEKLFYQNLACWGFIRSQSAWEKWDNQCQPPPVFHMGKGKYKTLGLYSHPLSPKERKTKLRSTGESHSPETESPQQTET